MAITNEPKQKRSIEGAGGQVTQDREASELARAGQVEDTTEASSAAAAGSVEGEGSYEGAREYGRGVRDFVRSGRVDEAAAEAERSLEQDAQELREAEQIGKSRARDWEGALQASEDTSPSGLDRLDPEARQRAVERIHQLMEEGYSERQAERIAVRLAEDWVELEKQSGEPAVHVVHERNGWAIHAQDEVKHESVDAIFDHMDDALRRAHEIAAELHLPLHVHGPDGALIDKSDA